MRSNAPVPTVMASGLFALDVIVEPDGRVHGSTLGGSAGNVLSILKALGWGAAPITTVGRDAAGQTLWNELVKLGIDTHCVQRSAGYRTPVVFQHLLPAGSEQTHRFSFSCPHCGRNTKPNFDQLGGAEEDPDRSSLPDVFFLDRPTQQGVELAEQYARSGAVVVFEPSEVGRQPLLFRRAVQAASIIKYADDRLDDLVTYCGTATAIEIQTRGKKGLRYRAPHLGGEWTALESYAIPELKDAAGAGDWCTAGLLFDLWRDGKCHINQLSSERIVRALSFGQALASFNCMTVGARGLLSKLTAESIVKFGHDISSQQFSGTRTFSATLQYETRKIHERLNWIYSTDPTDPSGAPPCCSAPDYLG